MGTNAGVTILLQPEGVRLPARLTSLDRFRAWTRSDSFPPRGRIDWLEGEVEVDMSPEEANTHGSLKVAISRDLSQRVEAGDAGVTYSDRMRYVNADAGLSVEPDVLVVFFETLESGRMRLVPAAPGSERILELEGQADLVVEVVSRSSETKDREKLFQLYHRAGVREYWLVDARETALGFTVYHRRAARYVASPVDAGGFRSSRVLGTKVRLVRRPKRAGVVRYRLEWARS
ncbi:MAG: Uma2 family endonuclease [Planctomycetes bacterium]|nr:Uma2 family endonuclease [Planctomycetota bacterium]